VGGEKVTAGDYEEMDKKANQLNAGIDSHRDFNLSLIKI